MDSAAANDLAVGVLVAGTYEVTGLVGRGGMGSVWAARHLRLPGKSVAIKVLHAAGVVSADAYARFRREAEIASRLGHPNIVEVLDFNSLPSGAPYLVMEFLRGEGLAARLRRGPVPIDEALGIARQVGSALAAAHRHGVVHRDLKPDNIFLVPADDSPVPRVKVLDFGISKIQGSQTVHTLDATLVGTPQYMSPEQAAGKNSEIDARTDVFALGLIVYEMLTGKAAFAGPSVAQVVFQVVYREPPPLASVMPGLPERVVSAVQRALAKEPDQRFQGVAPFIEALTGTPLRNQDGTQVPAMLARTEPSTAPADASIGFAATLPSSKPTPPAQAPGVAPASPSLAPTEPGRASVAVAEAPSPRREAPVALISGVAVLVVAGGVATGWWWARNQEVAPTPPVSKVPKFLPPKPPAPPVPTVVEAKAGTTGPVEVTDTAKPVALKGPPPSPAPEVLPEEARKYLDDAEEVVKRRPFNETDQGRVLRLTDLAIGVKPTPRAYLLRVRAYCLRKDWQNAKSNYVQHVRKVLGSRQKKELVAECRKNDVELE